MVTLLIVVFISLAILLIYVSGLLIFTPDAKDDKYVISILLKGFTILSDGQARKGTILGYCKEKIGLLIIIYGYRILYGRKYAAIKA